MASDQRPGGLTALAVINFCWGGLNLLFALLMLAAIPLMGMVMEEARNELSPEELAQFEAISEVGAPLYISLAVLMLLTAALLIASGVGYLKLKKFLGRTLGNSYAVLSVISTLGSALILPLVLGGGFNIMVIVSLIYPVLTLVLLNTTFKEDFVN